MTEYEEIRNELLEIKKAGWIPTLRKGNTGVGMTLETRLGLKENNVQLPDFGVVELKSHRRESSSLMTLFTFNRGVWQKHPLEIIKSIGYSDRKGRLGFKSTVDCRINNIGLWLDITDENLLLRYKGDIDALAIWSLEHILAVFRAKFPALILVTADSQLNNNGIEEFHYNEAQLWFNPMTENLVNQIKNNKLVMDIRMHKCIDRESVRNRGTAFRTHIHNLSLFFADKVNFYEYK